MEIVFSALPDVEFGHAVCRLPRLQALGVGTGITDFCFATLPTLEVAANGYDSGTGSCVAVLPALDMVALQRAGDYAICELPAFTMGSSEYAGELVPDDATAIIDLPALEVTAVGFSMSLGTCIATLPSLWAIGIEPAGGYAICQLPAMIVGSYDALAEVEYYAMMQQSPGVLFSSYGSNVAAITEELVFTQSSVYAINQPCIYEAIGILHPMKVSNHMQAALDEELVLGDAVVFVLHAIAQSTMGVAAPLAVVLTRIIELEETLLLMGAVSSRTEATAAIVEALLIEDVARSGWTAKAESSLSAAAVSTTQVRMIVNALAAVSLSASATPVLHMVALVNETLDVAAVLGTSARLIAAIEEGLHFSIALRFGKDEYTAVVLGMTRRAIDGSMVPAAVEYQNFPFNSFVEFEGTYYGASDHGVFALEGDDDDGEPIEAWIRTALSNLGTGRLKRMPDMFLGYTSSDQMVLKVVTTSDKGAKIEDWYILNERPAAAMRDGRIKVGRGLKSVYWAWELHNKAGGQFDLDVVELLPLIADRRIK